MDHLGCRGADAAARALNHADSADGSRICSCTAAIARLRALCPLRRGEHRAAAQGLSMIDARRPMLDLHPRHKHSGMTFLRGDDEALRR
jgi:hypothetical protein